MLSLTMADAKRALHTAHSATARLKNLREKGEQTVEQVKRSAEVMASAFTLGMISGAGVLKDGEIFHMPLELVAGIGFHGLRILGIGGRHGEDLSNFGDGALASYVNVLGRGVGAQHWGGGGTKGSMGGDLADRLSQIAANT
jgi:hypothetical protein